MLQSETMVGIRNACIYLNRGEQVLLLTYGLRSEEVKYIWPGLTVPSILIPFEWSTHCYGTTYILVSKWILVCIRTSVYNWSSCCSTSKTSTKNKRMIIRLDAHVKTSTTFFLKDYSNKISSISSQSFILRLWLSVKRPFVNTFLSDIDRSIEIKEELYRFWSILEKRATRHLASLF